MSNDSLTEKRCPKCGEIKSFDAFHKNISRKDGHHSICKACRAKYSAANADHIREYGRAWSAIHGDKKREYKRAYNTANREANRKANRAWSAAHREARAGYKRAYRDAHPEAHRDLHRASKHRYRARLNANGGNVTAQELTTKRASQNGLCFYCRMPHTPNELTIDHVIPICQGGPHIITNIVFACGICNSSKGNRTPEQWTNRWYERSSHEEDIRPQNREDPIDGQ